jgi:hypothetical protein
MQTSRATRNNGRPDEKVKPQHSSKRSLTAATSCYYYYYYYYCGDHEKLPTREGLLPIIIIIIPTIIICNRARGDGNADVGIATVLSFLIPGGARKCHDDFDHSLATKQILENEPATLLDKIEPFVTIGGADHFN